MYKCPLCGATSNRKGRAFSSTTAVINHIDAKRDDLHADENGDDHLEAIEYVEESAEDGPGPPESNSNDEPDGSPSETNQGDETPVIDPSGDPERMPEPVDTTPEKTEEVIDSGSETSTDEPIEVESTVKDTSPSFESTTSSSTSSNTKPKPKQRSGGGGAAFLPIILLGGLVGLAFAFLTHDDDAAAGDHQLSGTSGFGNGPGIGGESISGGSFNNNKGFWNFLNSNDDNKKYF